MPGLVRVKAADAVLNRGIGLPHQPVDITVQLDSVEGSALVGTEFVGWLSPNCQGERLSQSRLSLGGVFQRRSAGRIPLSIHLPAPLCRFNISVSCY
jgi:hypothetical protein